MKKDLVLMEIPVEKEITSCPKCNSKIKVKLKKRTLDGVFIIKILKCEKNRKRFGIFKRKGSCDFKKEIMIRID